MDKINYFTILYKYNYYATNKRAIKGKQMHRFPTHSKGGMIALPLNQHTAD